MYKVFINKKSLLITDGVSSGIRNKEVPAEPLFDQDRIYDALQHCREATQPGNAFLVGGDEKQLWKSFLSRFTIIEAAGGLVHTPDRKLLMIFRKGKWDLPKGKLDAGETPETAAVREVCEETGVCSLEITSAAVTTYHSYRQDKKNILKKTYWYEMNCLRFDGFVLQKEENIEQAGWYAKEEVKKRLEQSYPLIGELINSSKFKV